MTLNKYVLLVIIALLSTQMFADKVLLPEYQPTANSYVKSINIPGFDSLNKNRGTWLSIPKGSYSGNIECVVKGEPLKIKITIKATGDPKKLYVFSADRGCGYVEANEK